MTKCYFKGLYFEAELGFNCVTITLFINKRVAQNTKVRVKSSSKIKNAGVNICHTYDKYYYIIDSREFSGFNELERFFTDSIISVEKFINMEYYNSIKVTEEIYKSLC